MFWTRSTSYSHFGKPWIRGMYSRMYVFVKSKRMAWLGHLLRMEAKRIPKRVLEWKPTGRRNRERPRKRWIEDIEEDIQIMGIRGWRNLCKEKGGMEENH